MNEYSNNTNITHLKRPALAVIKKPLLTNDEMTTELVRLLNNTAPTVKPYIQAGGIFRAILALIHPETKAILGTRYIDPNAQLYLRKIDKNNIYSTQNYMPGLSYTYPDPNKIQYSRASKDNYYNNYTDGWVTTDINMCQKEASKYGYSRLNINEQVAIDTEAYADSYKGISEYKYRLYLFLDVDQKTTLGHQKNGYTIEKDLKENAQYPLNLFVVAPTQIKSNARSDGKVVLHLHDDTNVRMPEALRPYFSSRSLQYYDYSAYIWEFTVQSDYALLVLPRAKVQDILNSRNNKLQEYKKKIADLDTKVKTVITNINYAYKKADYIYQNERNYIDDPTTISGKLQYKFLSRNNTEFKNMLEKTYVETKQGTVVSLWSRLGDVSDELLTDIRNQFRIITGLEPDSTTESILRDYVDEQVPQVQVPNLVHIPTSYKEITDRIHEIISTPRKALDGDDRYELFARYIDKEGVRSNEVNQKYKDLLNKVHTSIDTWNNEHPDNPINKYTSRELILLLAQLQDVEDAKTKFLSNDDDYDIISMLYDDKISLSRQPQKIISKVSKDAKQITSLDFKVKYYLLLYKKIRQKLEDKYNYFIEDDNVNKTKIAHLVPEEHLNYIKNIYDSGEKIKDKKLFCQIMDNILFSPWSGIYISTDNNKYNLLYNITPTQSMIQQTSYEDTAKVDTFITRRNEDISNISISRASNGPSGATISLKNLYDKYTIPDTELTREKYYKHIGTSIIEEMDEIMVYLPKYYMADSNSNELELCFRGIVGAVNYQNESGYHSISITAKCPIKYLEMSKTNVKPSFSSSENKQFNNGIPYHIWAIPPEFINNMSSALSWIMTQSLSCAFCQPLPVSDKDETTKLISYTYIKNKNYNKEAAEKAKKENKQPEQQEYITRMIFSEPLFTYLWYVNNAVNDTHDQVMVNNAYRELINAFIETSYFDAKSQETKTVEGVSIVNINNKNIDIHKSPNISIFKYRANVPYIPINSSDNIIEDWGLYSDRFLVGRLTGTLQPVYSFATTETDIRISDYKTNIELIKDAVDKYNYAFYSDKSGIVTLTPLNTSLLWLNTALTENSTVNYDTLLYSQSNLDTTQKTNPLILTKEKIIRYTKSRDDSKVINFIQVNGQVPINQGIDQKNGNLAIIKSQPLINKYGVRAQKTFPLLGAKSASMCYAYGLAMLDRQNKLIESADIEAIGDASIELNNPIYCTADNTVYYLDGIRFSYTPGRQVTMSLACSYGRKPLLKLSDYIDSTIINNTLDIESTTVEEYLPRFNRLSLETALEATLSADKITPMTWIQLYRSLNNYETRDLDLFTKDAELAKTKCFLEVALPQIAFNGYIYDYIPSILVEDLIFAHQSLFKGANLGEMYLLLSEGNEDVAKLTSDLTLNGQNVLKSGGATVNISNGELVADKVVGISNNASEYIKPIPKEILAKYCIPFTAAYDGASNDAKHLFNAVFSASQTFDTSDIDKYL